MFPQDGPPFPPDGQAVLTLQRVRTARTLRRERPFASNNFQLLSNEVSKGPCLRAEHQTNDYDSARVPELAPLAPCLQAKLSPSIQINNFRRFSRRTDATVRLHFVSVALRTLLQACARKHESGSADKRSTAKSVPQVALHETL